MDAEADTEPAGPPPAGESSPKERSTWARLLSQVYEVDPLTCPRCGGRMKVIAFIHAPGLVDRLLRHVRGKQGEAHGARAPPAAQAF